MKFNKLVVVFSFALAAGVVAFFLGQVFVRKSGEVPVVSLPSEPSSSSSSSSSLPEVGEEVLEPATSYQYGYEKGFRAFMEQQGLPVPSVARYTSLVEGELDPEAAGRGYIDGYHSAGNSVYCPRSEGR